MKIIKTFYGKLRSRRGNALVLAILATMLLFIIGMVFLSSTMTQQATTRHVDQEVYLDDAIQIVIDQINEVLVKDLIRTGGTININSIALNNRDKVYDYPDEENFWLASLEPEFDDGSLSGRPPHYFWRHITDLWRKIPADMPPNEISWYDTDITRNDNPAEYDQQRNSHGPYGDLYRVSEKHMPIRPVSEEERINPAGYGPELNLYEPPPPDNWDPRPSQYIIHGQRADADGDGMADSRWTWLGTFGTREEDLWVAVRIIDNNGMVNINTAFRDPTFLVTAPGEWDGSRLTHINLEGMRSSSDPTIEALQLARYGTVPFLDSQDYYFDTLYEEDVAIRVLNPVGYPALIPAGSYQPFGWSDELELRNRYLLFTSVQIRCAQPLLWQATFNPGLGTVGKKLPYVEVLDPGFTPTLNIGMGTPLLNWYDKLTPDLDPPLLAATIGNYNRRHLFTTYNFDRILRRRDVINNLASGMSSRSGQRKVGIRLPDNGTGRGDGTYSGFVDAAAKERYIKELAGAIYRGLPSSNSTISGRFGSEYNRTRLAWHWALNIIDAQDTTTGVDEPSYYPRADLTDYTRYFGVESLNALHSVTLHISKLGYAEIPSQPNPGDRYPSGGQFYAVEVFDPNSVGQTTKDLDKYELWVVDDSNPPELKFTLELSGSIRDSNPADYTGDTELFVFYDQDANDVLSGAADEITEIEAAFINEISPGSFTVVNPSVSKKDDLFEDNDKIYVMYELADGKYMPVDVVKIPSGLELNGAAPYADVELRRISLPNTHFLLPAADTSSNFDPWSLATKPAPPADKLGADIDPDDTANGLIPITDPLSTYDTDFAGFDKIQHATESLPLRTLGEILDVPAVGFRHKGNEAGNPQEHECTTYWQALIESAVAIKSLGGTADLDADKDRGNELGSYGKVRLDDHLFMNWDVGSKWQNETVFDLLTYFDPSSDSADNDGNDYSDDPAYDGEDNDHDGLIDGGDPEEIFSNYGERDELNVAGRININTAPWFVIAQLPWIQDQTKAFNDPLRYALARAIVAYRDKTAIPGTPIDYATSTWPPPDDTKTRKHGMGLDPLNDPDVREERGFKNIWELINVTHDLQNTGGASYDASYDIRKYGRNDNPPGSGTAYNDNPSGSGNPGPFYSEDNGENDMKERDILFKRISNLVTVRSDVFTAYILVRIGRDGPQKRMMAIFDRSNVYRITDKPKLVALHPVPDPR